MEERRTRVVPSVVSQYQSPLLDPLGPATRLTKWLSGSSEGLSAGLQYRTVGYHGDVYTAQLVGCGGGVGGWGVP